jgi:hypothetical protein
MSTANFGLFLAASIVVEVESFSFRLGAVIRKISVISIRRGTGASATWLEIDSIILKVVASIRAFIAICL